MITQGQNQRNSARHAMSPTLCCGSKLLPKQSSAADCAGKSQEAPHSLLRRLGREFAKFRPVGLFHPRLEIVLGERLGKQLANRRPLVRIVDLVAAEPPADPGLRDPLLIANGGGFVLEG